MSDTHTHTRSIGALEETVDSFGDLEALEAEKRADLTATLVSLADAYGRRGEFDAEANTIDRLEEVYELAPEEPAELARALANATAVTARADVYESGIDPERIETYRARLETLCSPEAEEVVFISLAKATAQTAHAYGKAERPSRIASLVERLEEIYESYETAEVAAALARGHAYAERYLDSERDDRIDRVQSLYETHLDGDVAAGLAGVIAGRTNVDVATENMSALERRIARIETLAQQHPDSDVERWLPIATANATRASFEAADYERLEHWGKETVDAHDRLETPSSASWAAAALFYSARGSFFEGDVGKGERKLERLRELEARYENPVFEHWLARSMFDATRGYVETGRYEQARTIAEELEAYAEGHEDQDQIEAGLEALRSQAPGLRDPEQGVSSEPEVVDSEGASADNADELTRQPAAEPTSADEMSLESALETLEGVEESDDGCGSCGSGGCGSCGSGGTVEPASARTLVAAGIGIALVALAVVYSGYRLLKRIAP